MSMLTVNPSKLLAQQNYHKVKSSMLNGNISLSTKGEFSKLTEFLEARDS